MRTLFKAIPFSKEEVTLALESGIDGIIVPDDKVAMVSSLARCAVLAASSVVFIELASKSDEEKASASANAGIQVVLTQGWEIIPVENLLANSPGVALEVATLDEAKLARGILEKGVDTVVLVPESTEEMREIVQAMKYEPGMIALDVATVLEVTPVGMGHRVCVDTLSLLQRGQGMLVGNSSAFSLLVHAETEHNEYVAARPFRVNAGAVHAYVALPDDRTCYLEELRAGTEVLMADYTGKTFIATVGRVKIERRPMLLIRAQVKTASGMQEGTLFLQNAETIRVVSPEGVPISVVELQVGQQIVAKVDTAGRHFGMRITEDIKEV